MIADVESNDSDVFGDEGNYVAQRTALTKQQIPDNSQLRGPNPGLQFHYTNSV